MPASMSELLDCKLSDLLPDHDELPDLPDTGTPKFSEQKHNPLNIKNFGRYEVWEAGQFGKTYYSVWSVERTDIPIDQRHNDKPLTLDQALALAYKLHSEDPGSLILEPKPGTAMSIKPRRKRRQSEAA